MKQRYMYLRNRKNFPVACVATKLNCKENKIEYGFSVHNPEDQFDKRVARAEADKRLLNNTFSAEWSPDFSAHENTKSVLNDLLKQDNIPLMLRVAAKSWLKAFK